MGPVLFNMTILLIFCAVGFHLVVEAFILNQDKIDLTKHKNWPLVYHDENCGRSKLPLARKSITGRNADMGAYPWMARLVYRASKDDAETGSCGGSLINKRYILTAAHCCLDTAANAYGMVLAYVTLGEYDVHHIRDCYRGNCAPRVLEVEVEDIIKHPLYRKANPFSDDYCLLRLIHDVEFNDYIQPICLPSVIDNDEKTLYNMNMTVAGWGVTENLPQTRHPHILQEVDVVVRPTEFCDAEIEMHFDWESQICTGTSEPNTSPCPGDSGGPLMYYNTTGDSGRYVLMGVTAAGYVCLQNNLKVRPSIYARVSTVMPWILDNIH
ncbi:serine-type endopeptidase activity protein [Homalodisca vitripennis]|nr:serine-type endopeptidase activity protein [Homalodisca vitripennis]